MTHPFFSLGPSLMVFLLSVQLRWQKLHFPGMDTALNPFCTHLNTTLIALNSTPSPIHFCWYGYSSGTDLFVISNAENDERASHLPMGEVGNQYWYNTGTITPIVSDQFRMPMFQLWHKVGKTLVASTGCQHCWAPMRVNWKRDYSS